MFCLFLWMLAYLLPWQTKSASITHLQMSSSAVPLLDFMLISRHNWKFLSCCKMGHLEPHSSLWVCSYGGLLELPWLKEMWMLSLCLQHWKGSAIDRWHVLRVAVAGAGLRQCLVHSHMKSHGPQMEGSQSHPGSPHKHVHKTCHWGLLLLSLQRLRLSWPWHWAILSAAEAITDLDIQLLFGSAWLFLILWSQKLWSFIQQMCSEHPLFHLLGALSTAVMTDTKRGSSVQQAMLFLLYPQKLINPHHNPGSIWASDNM